MKHNRLYISADIEGVAGVVSSEQTIVGGFEYQQAREWMTGEVVSACNAAFDRGIEEIVVSDSHGNGQNLLLDQLPDNVQVVRSWPRPLCMMEGIQDGNYDAALLLGYHTGATQLTGVLAHTLSSKGIQSLRINGTPASETVVSAHTAGHFDVPVIMVSGDNAYIKHAREVLGDIETVTTKWVASTTSARTLLPGNARQQISQRVKDALDSIHRFQPLRLTAPITVELTCVNRKAAEILAFLADFERIDACTIQFSRADMAEVSKVLSFILSSGVLSV